MLRKAVPRIAVQKQGNDTSVKGCDEREEKSPAWGRYKLPYRVNDTIGNRKRSLSKRRYRKVDAAGYDIDATSAH